MDDRDELPAHDPQSRGAGPMIFLLLGGLLICGGSDHGDCIYCRSNVAHSGHAGGRISAGRRTST